jgi:hypothetical protein
MLVVKLFGVLLVVFVSAVMGFLKSRSLTNRSTKLAMLFDGTNMLFEYIEQEGCELDEAVKKSFKNCDFLSFKNGVEISCDADLNNEDKAETENFFALLGTGTKKTECDRIANFKLKIKSLHTAAEKEASQKCRIYQTFGICIGLSIGILLI